MQGVTSDNACTQHNVKRETLVGNECTAVTEHHWQEHLNNSETPDVQALPEFPVSTFQDSEPYT